jgi:hypothetical protein
MLETVPVTVPFYHPAGKKATPGKKRVIWKSEKKNFKKNPVVSDKTGAVAGDFRP